MASVTPNETATLNPTLDDIITAQQLEAAQASLKSAIGKFNELVKTCSDYWLKNCLTEFTEDIKDANGNVLYTQEELNDALVTVFGEVRSLENGEPFDDEARAIAATIFNRQTRIADARKDYEEKVPGLEKQESEMNIIIEEIDHECRKASQQEWEKCNAEWKAKQIEKDETIIKPQQAIKQERSQAETYLTKTDDENTLTNIVSAILLDKNGKPKLNKNGEIVTQYAGYEKGTDDKNAYEESFEYEKLTKEQKEKADPSDKKKKNNVENMVNQASRERHCKRWQAAKNAIDTLARDPSQRACYERFVAVYQISKNQPRKKAEGEDRIGETDFWYRGEPGPGPIEQKECPQK